MDILLLKDVEHVGAQGTVVQVKPGFARNFLLPQGLAVPATDQQLKAAQERQRQHQDKVERMKAQAELVKRQLEGRSLTLKLSLGQDDKPFGAITTPSILYSLPP